MEKLYVNLENCFGIEKLEKEFDFSKDNVSVVYARNGLMKTSFSKTFKKIQTGKRSEIKDEIFGMEGKINIDIDGVPIESQDIFVIKSFESEYESTSISTLLIDQEMKASLDKLLNQRKQIFKVIEKMSGLKEVKAVLGKKVYELETKLVQDFNFKEPSFLLNIEEIANIEEIYYCPDIPYTAIFDETVLKKIESKNFQSKIDEFINESEVIYGKYKFLDKGKLSIAKLKRIRKALEEEKFFVKSNYLTLEGDIEIKEVSELQKKLDEINEDVKATPALKEIEKLLADVKGTTLKDIIELNPDLVQYLKIDKLSQLRKDLWISYIKSEHELFTGLLREYKAFELEIRTKNYKMNLWQKSLEIFKQRFTVPYTMEIENLKGAVLGESIPRIQFQFEKQGHTITLDRNKLEKLDILSQGEKRALYLLNIIFDIETISLQKKETLFIVDDIADSFDYKNKYAIIEYLHDITQNRKNKMIILTHNFDFFRTVASRLGVCRENRLNVNIREGKMLLEKEKYQNQPFVNWSEEFTIIHALALIPFMRNIIEYGRDRGIYIKETGVTDFDVLTGLLHQKENTNNLIFEDIKKLYAEYLGVLVKNKKIPWEKSIILSLYDEADKITSVNVDLEYKLILSMAIRHKAEATMIKQIGECQNRISWKDKREEKYGTGKEFLENLISLKNQTRELFKVYSKIECNENIQIMSEVNIMTPENIHLNSFMYEPILDMDITELLDLYMKVKILHINELK